MNLDEKSRSKDQEDTFDGQTAQQKTDGLGQSAASKQAAQVTEPQQILAADSERLFIGDILADENSDLASDDKASQRSCDDNGG